MGCSNSKAAAAGAYPIKLDEKEEQPRTNHTSNKAFTSYQHDPTTAPEKTVSDDCDVDPAAGITNLQEGREGPDTSNDAEFPDPHFDVCFDDNDALTEEETNDPLAEEEEAEEEEEEEEWIEPTTPYIDPETDVVVLNKEKDPFKWAYEVWSMNHHLLPWRPASNKEESKLCMTILAEIRTTNEETETEDMTEFSANEENAPNTHLVEEHRQGVPKQMLASNDSMGVSERAAWLKNEAFGKSQTEKNTEEKNDEVNTFGKSQKEKKVDIPASPDRQSVADRVAWLKTEVVFSAKQEPVQPQTPQSPKQIKTEVPKKPVVSVETPTEKVASNSHTDESAEVQHEKEEIVEEEREPMGVSERAAWLKNDAFGKSQKEKKVEIPESPHRQSVADRVAWLKTEVSFTSSSPKKSPSQRIHPQEVPTDPEVPVVEKKKTLDMPPLETIQHGDRQEAATDEGMI